MSRSEVCSREHRDPELNRSVLKSLLKPLGWNILFGWVLLRDRWWDSSFKPSQSKLQCSSLFWLQAFQKRSAFSTQLCFIESEITVIFITYMVFSIYTFLWHRYLMSMPHGLILLQKSDGLYISTTYFYLLYYRLQRREIFLLSLMQLNLMQLFTAWSTAVWSQFTFLVMG